MNLDRYRRIFPASGDKGPGRAAVMPGILKRVPFLILFAVLLLTLPAAAMILETTYQGTVTGTGSGDSGAQVLATHRYGCDFTPETGIFCSFAPIEPVSLTGPFRAPAKVPSLDEGDVVEVTVFGIGNGTWKCLARLVNDTEDRQWAVAFTGDPNALKTPLVGGYTVTYEPVPDCSRCDGALCQASSVRVKIMDGDRVLDSRVVRPKGSFTYAGRNDGSRVSVTWLAGTVRAEACPEAYSGIMDGPQSWALFEVGVTPPVGFELKGAASPVSGNGGTGAVFPLEAVPGSVPPKVRPKEMATTTLVLKKPKDLVPCQDRAFDPSVKASLAASSDHAMARMIDGFFNNATFAASLSPDERRRVQEIALDTDLALFHSVLPDRMTLFSGVSRGDVAGQRDLRPFIDRGFGRFSYDLSLVYAMQDQIRHPDGYADICVLQKSRGDQGLFIDENRGSVLLPRGTKYQVTGWKRVGKLVIQADFPLKGSAKEYRKVNLFTIEEMD